MVEEVDWSVGRVVEALWEEKLDRNTLVFFTSDNGPWLIFGEHDFRHILRKAEGDLGWWNLGAAHCRCQLIPTRPKWAP